MRKRLLSFLLLAAAGLQAKPGFFSVAQKDGRWWLQDPKGRPFFMNAVNCVLPGPLPKDANPANPEYAALRHYPDTDAWGKASLARLKSWGYNTLGGYSSRELYAKAGWPYTVSLAIGAWISVPWLDVQDGLPKIRELAQELAPYKDDRNLVGYFIDNELGWWDEAILTHWLTQDAAKARPKRQLLEMLKAEYGGDLKRLLKEVEFKPKPGDWKRLEGAFKEVRLALGAKPAAVHAFTAWIAEEYYRTLAAEIRKVDPNHLLLGDRYLSYHHPEVVKAAGRHMDVVSANYNTYSEDGWIAPAFFNGLYAACGRPIMVTEYYFSAMQNASGNKNKNGPFITVQTQEERAAGAAAMARRMTALPYVVGHHWFQFVDEPTHGRSDGEDFNFGLIDIHDRPYPLLVEALGSVQRGALKLHGSGRDFAVAAPGRLAAGVAGMKADGYLDEWDLEAAWLGHPAGPGPSPADFYAAWNGEGLWLALGFQDYDTRQDPKGPPAFEVTVGRQGARRSFRAWGFGGSSKGKRVPGAAARFAPLKLEGEGRLKGSRAAKESVGVNWLGEIFLSNADLGGALAAGEAVELDLGLRLKGPGRRWALKAALKP